MQFAALLRIFSARGEQSPDRFELEVGIAAEEFIRAFTRQAHLDSATADVPGQHHFGERVVVVEGHFGCVDGCRNIVGDLPVRAGHRLELLAEV